MKIKYRNLTADGLHGDLELALKAAAPDRNPHNKPLFCNFFEWSASDS
jgi:hypothetical protein